MHACISGSIDTYKTIMCSYHMQTGIMVEVDGREMRVYGTVLVLLADTLAAHQLGSFKVGVGFSLRKCRQCMVTFNDMQTQVGTLLLIFHYILCCIDYI